LAALIEACDAVVTISNTTAHIAGALGKPVWVLIPYHGHGQLWYWSKDRKDNLWYPEARICRQQKGQPWADLIASVTPEVAEFLQTKKAGGG
jgi:ADP-heptose:LPS heptosyltransferase